jgi:hypothetical protein
LAVPAFFYHVFLFRYLYICPTCMYHFCICSTTALKLLTAGKDCHVIISYETWGSPCWLHFIVCWYVTPPWFHR